MWLCLAACLLGGVNIFYYMGTIWLHSQLKIRCLHGVHQISSFISCTIKNLLWMRMRNHWCLNAHRILYSVHTFCYPPVILSFSFLIVSTAPSHWELAKKARSVNPSPMMTEPQATCSVGMGHRSYTHTGIWSGKIMLFILYSRPYKCKIAASHTRL